MIKNSMTIKIGGEAGMGVESGGAGLVKALTRGGLHVFAFQDYMSRIRGGHNFFQIRVSAEEKQAWAQRAQKDGRDLSGWVRFIADREAAAS